MTESAVFMQRPQRWDVPFGPDMTEADVDRLLSIAPISRVDPERFRPPLTLRQILRNDTRIVRYRDGDIVVREGDYGDTAFVILSGRVRVAMESLPPELLGRRAYQKKSFFRAVAQLWQNPREVEVRDAKSVGGQSPDRRASTRTVQGDTRVFLQDVSTIIGEFGTDVLSAGDLFGEQSALGRVPRSATVFAEGDVELLEMRWQGLRDIRKKDEVVKQFIDQRYRERGLEAHLRSTPLFAGLEPAAIKEIANATRLESYGDFEWHSAYRRMAQKDSAARLGDEPVIVEEGHYLDGLILVRAGFVRVSRQHGHGSRTVSYLGRGQVYGLDELRAAQAQEAAGGGSAPALFFGHTLRAIGYVDVLRVPTTAVERFVLPAMTTPRRTRLPLLSALAGLRPKPSVPSGAAASRRKVDPGMLEFLVEGRYINGTATMLIDMDRCTRCDECVRACGETHGNNPRFVRHGPIHGHHMVASACGHCQDPVCMIGCPTGAIHREATTGDVVINEQTCIGCTICAESCPYDNIRMVDVRDAAGNVIRDAATQTPIAKATKCDLCTDQWGGPACQRACPHDALIRVDLSDPDLLPPELER